MSDPLAVATILAAGIASVPATFAAISARRTHHAVQPNGETIAEMLAQQNRWDAYGHTRFHDIINSQAYVLGFLYLMARQAGWDIPTAPLSILTKAAEQMGYRMVPYSGDPDLPDRPPETGP